MFSNFFIRLNWLSLILIYSVVIAGSFVRITGSGMGCPDWPKCFGSWIPPTSAKQLPENYRAVYGEQRVKKVEKFAKILTVIGLSETAEKIKLDPATYEELPFNAGKTWMEYVNRLAGFLAGNAVLGVFLMAFFKYRKQRKLVLIATLNLVLLGFQAWFGSIVVATNLVPWTITIHLFLALVIIGLQLYLIVLVTNKNPTISFSKPMKVLIYSVLAITTYQLFLGTQVRESIDELTKQGIPRELWSAKFGWTFFIHRSFSWLVLGLMTIMLWLNWKGNKQPIINWLYVVLAVELISGVCLAYAELPGLVRVSHLLFATILFGILLKMVLQLKWNNKELN